MSGRTEVRPPSPRFRSKIEFLLSCEKKTPKPVRTRPFARRAPGDAEARRKVVVVGVDQAVAQPAVARDLHRRRRRAARAEGNGSRRLRKNCPFPVRTNTGCLLGSAHCAVEGRDWLSWIPDFLARSVQHRLRHLPAQSGGDRQMRRHFQVSSKYSRPFVVPEIGGSQRDCHIDALRGAQQPIRARIAAALRVGVGVNAPVKKNCPRGNSLPNCGNRL